MPLARVLLLAPALLLAGCGLFESRADRALEASPDFKAGYSDGCSSASTQGANKRDDSLDRDDEGYRSNKAYRQGWNTGFGACRMYQPQSNQPGDAAHGPIADPGSR